MINAIPKIYTLGHRLNADILSGNIVVQEKIDGSQFSFGNVDGKLECRSKGAQLSLSDAGGMFGAALATAGALFDSHNLPAGWVFRCEYLQKPKHNVLTYARIPDGHLVLFDASAPDGQYLCPQLVRKLAAKLGLEPTPVLFDGSATLLTEGRLTEFLAQVSVLGGCNMEGVVIKNYGLPHPESESGSAPLTAKLVSEKFKEVHARSPINTKAAPNDFIQSIVNCLRTEARWLKAIQHLKEAGQLTNAETDIGPLVHEIQRDCLTEEADRIKEALFKQFQKEIAGGVVRGFAQYYKAALAGGLSIWQQQQIK